jgi:hypothetical protein
MAHLSLHHDEHGSIEFRYHPETRTRSYNSGWKSTTVAGSDDPLLSWSGGEGKKYSFSVELTSEEQKHLDKLWLAGQSEPWKKPAPPVWKLVIGSKVIPVVLESLEYEEEMFDKRHTAAVTTAKITLQKWREYKLSVS